MRDCSLANVSWFFHTMHLMLMVLIICCLCRAFKTQTKVDKVVVLWTANTERYSDVIVGLNDTKESLFASLEEGESEISPSTLFALACIHECVPFINGSPQNTFVPGKSCVLSAISLCILEPPFRSAWFSSFFGLRCLLSTRW